ncbi:MAG: rhamnulokinase [Streptococcaceae bacterium]|jgi:rhamnulokinase/L-fuculokinase|nr:rhamnulokinase [Streptococcaceae bacterium]
MARFKAGELHILKWGETMGKNVLAFDLGASSGRAILGRYENGVLQIEEIHRFHNAVVKKDGKLFWNLDYLFSEILVGLEKATAKYPIDSIGFDTWGVDFAAIDEEGQLLQNPLSYRGTETDGMLSFLEENYCSAEELYQETGIQIMEINSLFQLLALKQQAGELFQKTKYILNIPDLFNYLLTGEIKAEMSIASTTQLMNPHSKTWDKTLLEKIGLPVDVFPPLVEEGNILGKVKTEFTQQKQAIQVINVCEHDTASALVCVPTQQQDFIFISSGTWSLIGTELQTPIISKDTYHYQLTNEIGQNKRTELLKNCTGLWIIQELQKEFDEQGENYSFAQMTELAMTAPVAQTMIDTEDARFAKPDQMIEKIQAYAAETQQVIPQTAAELFRCVYESLALQYKATIDHIKAVTGKAYETIYIVGGGSQSELLCQLVADVTNTEVCAGPAEATALGNITIQFMAQGIYDNVQEIRDWTRTQTDLKNYLPRDSELWQKIYQKYQKLISSKEMRK